MKMDSIQTKMDEAKVKFDPSCEIFGGFTTQDGTIDFYGRVNSVLKEEMVVLDLGAGRGAWFEDDPCLYRKSLRTLKGKAAKVIAADIDEAVQLNKWADETILMTNDRIPVRDESIDLLIADYVLEHVADPVTFRAEVDRVLRRNGYFCARTPHKCNYVSILARLIPNERHAKVLKYAQPTRREADVFPTAYKMNSLSEIEKLFPTYESKCFIYRGEPSYYFGNRYIYRFLSFVFRISPAPLVGNIFVFLQKK